MLKSDGSFGPFKAADLVVEHEASLVTALRDNAEKQGFSIESEPEGWQALARFEEIKPDLVLLDWMLPGDARKSKFAVSSAAALATSCR